MQNNSIKQWCLHNWSQMPCLQADVKMYKIDIKCNQLSYL